MQLICKTGIGEIYREENICKKIIKKSDLIERISKNKLAYQKLSLINHKHIIKFIVYNEDENSFISEFFNNSLPLPVFLKNNILSFNEIVRLFYDLANAIDFLHYNKLAHNDIRLLNVLIDKDLNLKLNDFDFLNDISCNENLKYIDIHSFATLIYKILFFQKSFFIKEIISFDIPRFQNTSCKEFLDNLNIKEIK